MAGQQRPRILDAGAALVGRFHKVAVWPAIFAMPAIKTICRGSKCSQNANETPTASEAIRFAAAPSHVLLGLICGAIRVSPKPAAHEIGEHVTRPNEHQREQQ